MSVEEPQAAPENSKLKKRKPGARGPLPGTMPAAASLANLIPIVPGQVMNPSGGPKSKPISDAIKRLAKMSPAELEAYEPLDGWEKMAKARIEHGQEKSEKGAVQSFEAVADRVEGKVQSGDALAGAGTVIINITSVENKW